MLRACHTCGPVLCGPWYRYITTSSRPRFCQPDFVLQDASGSEACIVEVKLSWTSDAWWQLKRIYLPVLKAAHPEVEFRTLVICASYDPAILANEDVTLVDSIESVALFPLLLMRL